MVGPIRSCRIAAVLRSSTWATGLFLLCLILLALLAWGCSSDEKPVTATATAGSGAMIQTVSALEPEPVYTAPEEPMTAPTAAITPTTPLTGTGPVELVIANAQPASVGRGEPVTYTIKTRGAAVSVTMEVKGLEMIDVPLINQGAEGDLLVWTATVPAPQTPGNYRYLPAAIDADGAKIVPDSASAGAGYLTVT